jgi:hypothetical protein
LWVGIVILWIVISAIIMGYGMGLSWFETVVRKVSYDVGSDPSMITRNLSLGYRCKIIMHLPQLG